MAKFTDVNTIGSGAAAMFRLKTVLKAAGWTVPYSSDGSTYNASGDQITAASSGAGGMANNNAWYAVREPGNRREWSMQRSNSGNQTWRIKYSALSHFTGGSPSSIRTPSAADEQIIVGSGSDASPGFGTFFGSDSSYRVHIVANSTPIGGVYPFIMFTTLTPGATFNGGALWQEPMAPGSYDIADADPCIVGLVGNGGSIGQILTTGSRGWLAYGTGSAVWLATVTGANAAFTGSLPSDLVNGKDVNGRPLYQGTSGGTRFKGYGAVFAVKGPARDWPATANRTTDAYVYLSNMVLPFADNTEPGV